MKAYFISCHSNCGSYFASYLQELLVLADSKEMALTYAAKWLKDNNEQFLKPLEECHIEETEVKAGVLNYVMDSDY